MELPCQIYQGENSSRNLIQGRDYQSPAREGHSTSPTHVGDNNTRNGTPMDQENQPALEEDGYAVLVIFTFKNFYFITYLPFSFLHYLRGDKPAPKQPPGSNDNIKLEL